MKFPFWLTISRPRFWMYLIGPALIGLASYYTKTHRIPWEIWPWLLYFTLPANLFIYGVNDLFDYETDKLNVKKQGYESHVPPNKRTLITVMILGTQLPFLPLFVELHALSSWFLASFIFFGFFYSAPPLRFKTKPFLDSASNILYAMPGFFIYTHLTNTAPPFSLILAAGLWCMAMHAFSAIPDIEADSKARIHTIATILGANTTLTFCFLCFLFSALFVFRYLPGFAICSGVIYLGYLASLKMTPPKDWLKTYSFFPLINTLMGMLLCFSVLVPSLF